MKRFTMVEMLVVVAVISILVSILVPALSRAREVAYRASCASQLSSIGKTITKKYVDNSGYLPSYNWMSHESMSSSYICPKDDSSKSMEFYVEGSKSWDTKETSFGFNLGAINKNILRLDNFSTFVISFDSSDMYGTWVAPRGNGNGNNGHGNNVGGYDPSNPGQGGITGDSNAEDIELNGNGTGIGPNWSDDVGGLDPADYDNWYYGNVNYRHLGTANHLMMDGSVKIIHVRLPLHYILWQ
jgi:prepilin-type N-terminal cleavage/methylation domain-containing protein